MALVEKKENPPMTDTCRVLHSAVFGVRGQTPVAENIDYTVTALDQASVTVGPGGLQHFIKLTRKTKKRKLVIVSAN